MKKIIGRQTEGGKIGGLDGLNLFFGALLGANLGSIEKVPLYDYVKLIVLLAGTVMTIRMISTSKQRKRMLATVFLYVVLIAAFMALPSLRPKGLAPEDLHRLVATLAIWISFVLLIEFTPTHPDEEDAPAKTVRNQP